MTDRIRYWASRHLRALARTIEPTVEVDWAQEAYWLQSDTNATTGTATIFTASSTWPGAQ